ncbi:hypothetical protein AOQ84DRAFT_345562 [Glonium stellatum]|uniref:Uncharacterized protein n=1 Tax=Glonium stellatum TaxID=574774 RepID=A0A8E2EU15_9PEZI|nr:hypothetical protein AOQ84DRAFT_345562 [Glonium stellatum]
MGSLDDPKMVLPEPTISFTIPSIHDDTPLDCRVYYPTPLRDCTLDLSEWRKKGAVIAHPYAPLGGSYDDHVVGIIADELLKEGFVVGTFNFRGAHSSKGRTSWTGKPELDDYVSFAGFFIHYLHLLRPSASRTTSPSTPSVPSVPSSPFDISTDGRTSPQNECARVILGGYSYGSLIVKHIPPTAKILELFHKVEDGTAAAEILLRASNLSAQRNREWENALAARGRQQSNRERRYTNEHSLSVIVGGEETSPEKRRSSRETRRSSERDHSFEFPRGFGSMSLRRKKREHSLCVIESQIPLDSGPSQSTAYLLVSPLLPPLSTFAAPSMVQRFWSKSKDHHENIVLQPTLAVFGDHDFFTSVKKLRPWAEKLNKELGSGFTYEEIGGAGHFWHEHGVEPKLRDALRKWAHDLDDAQVYPDMK